MNLIDTVLLVIAIALLLVVSVLCVSVCMMREEEENVETYDLASEAEKLVTEISQIMVAEFNELVDTWDSSLWWRGLEIGHDGRLIPVHTAWALGFSA